MKIIQQIVIISILITIFIILTACGKNNIEQDETDTTYEQSPAYDQNTSIVEVDTSSDEANDIEPIELSSHEYGRQVATEFLSDFTTLFFGT